MSQFDVHEYSRARGKALGVVDLQSDLLAGFDTRVVAPVYEKGSRAAIRGINPELEFKGMTCYVSMAELAAVHRRELGARVGSMRDAGNELVAAIDVIFTGI